MSIANQIAALRKSRGWSQAELARRAAIPQPRVAELETATIDPRLSSIERVASALGARVLVRRKR